MMNTAKIQPALKRIEDLSLRELDMAYSLSRIGWSCPALGKRYRISESDVRKIVDDYVEVRELCEARRSAERQQANPEPELTAKKPRKRRCDAKYATSKERQAAYRARLKEKRHAGMQFPSPAPVMDSSTPMEEQVSVTAVDIP